MITKQEFIMRMLAKIKKELEKELPDEENFSDMFAAARNVISDIIGSSRYDKNK